MVSIDDDDNDVVDADADDLHLPLPTLHVSAMTKFSQNRLSLISTNGVDVEDDDVDDNNDILDDDDIWTIRMSGSIFKASRCLR